MFVQFAPGSLFKDPPFRSEKWLQAVREIEFCVLCGKFGVQAAHRNEGKGKGMKASDCLAAAICPECHHDIDQGVHLTRDERRSMIDRAIVLTIERLAKSGRLVIA